MPATRGDQRTLLTEVRHVLRPGGVLYVSDLLVNSDRRNVERYERDAKRFGVYGIFELPEGVIVRHHREEWIEELTSYFVRLEYAPFQRHDNEWQFLSSLPVPWSRTYALTHYRLYCYPIFLPFQEQTWESFFVIRLSCI